MIVIRNLSVTYSLAFVELKSHALDTISTVQDKIGDMRLLQKAAKLLWQNIFSAAQEFDDSFTQDSEEWLMLCVMSKILRRSVKYSMKNSLRNDYYQMRRHSQPPIRDNFVNFSATNPQVILMMLHRATKKRKWVSCSCFSSYGNAKANPTSSLV